MYFTIRVVHAHIIILHSYVYTRVVRAYITLYTYSTVLLYFKERDDDNNRFVRFAGYSYTLLLYVMYVTNVPYTNT